MVAKGRQRGKATQMRSKEYPNPVAVQLITHLSEGAYTTFPKAVKELVINSFDSDAKRVDLIFSDEFTKLTIEDDGEGISETKFKEEFLRIGGSKRRLEERIRPYNRPIIGRFGIGFLSVARLCDSVTIVTKTKGTTKAIVRQIPLKHFFDEKNRLKNLQRQYYFYSLPSISGENRNKSYTKIVLDGLRPDIVADLSCVDIKDNWDVTDELPGLEGVIWQLGLLLPVRYKPGFPVKRKDTQITKQLKSELDKFCFSVFVNGIEVRKPVCLGYQHYSNSKWNYSNGRSVPACDRDIFRVVSPRESSIRFRGYIYNQSKQIQPAALRGIILRVNHVGIKGFSRSLFEYSSNIGPILAQISGEIFLDTDFEEVLTLDKDDFKEDHPLYKELVGYIHDTIKDVADRSRARSSSKKTGKASKTSPTLRNLTFRTRSVKEAKKILGDAGFNTYFPDLDVTLKRRIVNLRRSVKSLVGKTLDEHEGSYMIESLNCFGNDCLRASIIMAWNAGIARMHRKILKDIGFKQLEKVLVELNRTGPHFLRGKIKTKCDSLDALKEFPEKILCLAMEKLELFDRGSAQLFFKSLGPIRDNNAHPTGHRPAETEVLLMIQSTLDRVLNQPKFKVDNA